MLSCEAAAVAAEAAAADDVLQICLQFGSNLSHAAVFDEGLMQGF